MKKVYELALTMVLAGSSIVAFSQVALRTGSIRLAKPSPDMPKVAGSNPNNRVSNSMIPVELNYVQADSTPNSGSYTWGVPWEFNSRYTLADTVFGGAGINQLLLHYYGVVFDTMYDAPSKTGYASKHVQNIVLDSIYVYLSQQNFSGLNDTLILDIDSVSSIGWPVKVLKADTLIAAANFFANGLGFYSALDFNSSNTPILPLTINNNKFGIFVFYYGPKQDTCELITGAPYAMCSAGAENGHDIPQDTYFGIGSYPKTWNSMTNGYQYWFKPKNITFPGSQDTIVYPCTTPGNGLLYFQDIGIISFCNLNINGVNEVTSNGLTVSQNFPNPFNQATQIKYNLTKSSNVVFTVYDLTGRQLVNTNYNDQAAGDHFITLNANQLTPGIYFYSFNVNGNVITQKMIVTQ